MEIGSHPPTVVEVRFRDDGDKCRGKCRVHHVGELTETKELFEKMIADIVSRGADMVVLINETGIAEGEFARAHSFGVPPGRGKSLMVFIMSPGGEVGVTAEICRPPKGKAELGSWDFRAFPNKEPGPASGILNLRFLTKFMPEMADQLSPADRRNDGWQRPGTGRGDESRCRHRSAISLIFP